MAIVGGISDKDGRHLTNTMAKVRRLWAFLRIEDTGKHSTHSLFAPTAMVTVSLSQRTLKPRGVICLKSHKEPGFIGFILGLGMKNLGGTGEKVEWHIFPPVLVWVTCSKQVLLVYLFTYILELVYQGSQEPKLPEDRLSPPFTAAFLVMSPSPKHQRRSGRGCLVSGHWQLKDTGLGGKQLEHKATPYSTWPVPGLPCCSCAWPWPSLSRLSSYSAVKALGKVELILSFNTNYVIKMRI